MLVRIQPRQPLVKALNFINKFMRRYYQHKNLWFCGLCERSFNSRQATTSHIHRTHDNPGVCYGGLTKGKTAWNKGLSKTNDIRVQKYSSTLSQKLKGKPGKPHTAESKRKISLKMSAHNKGGRCQWYEVAGQKVQGTWEKNIAEKLESFGVLWEKLKCNKHTLKYFLDGKERNYTPDFYLKDYDVYLEVKGHWWGDDREKMKAVSFAHPHKNIILIERPEYEWVMS